MRKSVIIVLALAWVLATSLFGPASAIAAGQALSSTFPVYLFTKNITQGSDTFDVKLMIDSSLGCPHDYAPSPADLERLSQANLLVINGSGLESFLPRALRVAQDTLKIIDASGNPEILVDRAKVMSAPMLLNGPNPHLFASPSTATAMVGNIAEGLSVLDPDKAQIYRANGARLIEEMSTVAKAMRSAGERLNHPKVIISHSVFEFLAKDMGLEVVAMIEQADGAEPSAARLSELVNLARDSGVRAIIVDPEGEIKAAQTLGAEAKIPVVIIDPVATGSAEAPLDYYQKVMISNMRVLVDLFSTPPEQPKKSQGK